MTPQPPRPPPPAAKAQRGDAALLFGVAVLGGGAAAAGLLPEDVRTLLVQLLWRTQPEATLTCGLGIASVGLVALVGSGRRVRWLTREHRDAQQQRRQRWRAMPARIKRDLVSPPLVAFAALGLPHLGLWSVGLTRFRWPDWIGTEVPVEPWVAVLIELLGGPLGDGWNLVMPAVGWGVLVGAAWQPWRQAWERRVLDGRPFTGRQLPAPPAVPVGASQPVFLLGARERPASRPFEPYCPLPSWVRFEGESIFGGLVVFGQKGSGKTSLLMRIIEDTLRFAPSDPTLRPALVALDPKGDLSDPIEALAASVGRSADVVRLGVGGPIRWNPFGHLGPATPARQIRQAGYFLSCAMPRSSGDAAYWEDNATNLLSYGMQLLAYAGRTVSFASLAALVTQLKDADDAGDEGQFRETLYLDAQQRLTALDPDGAAGLLDELRNVRSYFEEEFVHLDAKPRGIVVNTATNFLRKFEGAAYRRAFCGSPSDPGHFSGFEALVDTGRIFVLDIRSVEDGQVAPALCCLAKLFCQAAILTRDRRGASPRVVVNVLDEYQQYVTAGGNGRQGDPEYLETSRSFRAVDVVATQQLTALADAVGGRDAAQRVVGSFNALVLFRHNDAALTQYASHLVGRRDEIERSHNVAEGGSDASRRGLGAEAFGVGRQSVTRSVSERTVPREILTDDVFASLQTFEAIGIVSGAEGRRVLRFCSKPQWLPVRTPQHAVLARLGGASGPAEGGLQRLWRRLFDAWRVLCAPGGLR